MSSPDVQHTTIAALAKTFNIEPEDFDRVWRSTPVPITRRKAGPGNEESRQFAAACREAKITPAEAMRRLRSWLVAQEPAKRLEVLSFKRAADVSGAMFSDLVDHLQDPAAAVARRVGRRAASSARQRESDAKGESKRR